MADWLNDVKNSDTSSWKSGSPEKGKKGRPKVDESQKRKQRFTMNMNDAEYDLILKAAELSGHTQAGFSRMAAIEKARIILSEGN